jgi:hypothetical protein
MKTPGVSGTRAPCPPSIFLASAIPTFRPNVSLPRCERPVNALADVRSVPFSRWSPWFSVKALVQQLAQAGISYALLGDTLGGRPRSESLYRDGVADYEAMAAAPEFRAALSRLAA